MSRHRPASSAGWSSRSAGWIMALSLLGEAIAGDGVAAAGSAGARPTRSGLDEAAADRVAGELHPVAHAELLEDVRAVALDRLLGDEQQLADLLVGVRLGDE